MKPNASLLSCLLFCASPALISYSHATELMQNFTIDSIKIDGLIRIDPEIIYANLPISSGDVATQQSVNDSIKSLYQTEYFSNVIASREGNVLLFKVVENPVITNIEFEKNKLIPTEALKNGFEQSGIKKGQPVNDAMLDRIKKDIEKQYASQGLYNATVTFEKKVKANNSVELIAKFIEGDPAKVVTLEITGNKHFSDNEIKDALLISDKAGIPFFGKKNRFAESKLNASLEKLNSLYLNEGFVDVVIDKPDVKISQDSKTVDIQLSIKEGLRYKFGKANYLGNTIFDDAKLQALTKIQKDEMFSQDAIMKTVQELQRLYNKSGYFYAKVRPIPRLNKETKKVDIDFVIDTDRQIFVRNINFIGNNKTEDRVLRSELRQLEGALASKEKIQLSKIRLQRTGFFKNVEIQVRRLDGASDKVDIEIVVEEQASGTTSLSAGYSQNGGITFQAGLSQKNFFGTGNAVDLQLSRSDTLDNYNIGVTDPNFTINGISQSFNLYYRKTKVDKRNINNYITDSVGAKLSYGYPVDEETRLSFGLGIDNTVIKAGPNIALANIHYMLDSDIEVITDESQESSQELDAIILNDTNRYRTEYLNYNLNFVWSNNSLDKPVFPSKGLSHSLSAEIGLPGSDASYQKLTYSGNAYQPLGLGFVARVHSKLGFGNNLPFYKNFTAGGFGSLRGYNNGTLGPRSDALVYVSDALNGGEGFRDPNPEYVGGNTLLQAGAELIVPLPFKSDWTDKVRLVLFSDTARVYDQSGLKDKNFKNLDVPLIVQDDDFRSSYGISTTWLTPIGPISFSYSEPINPKESDSTKKLQFDVGRVF